MEGEYCYNCKWSVVITLKSGSYYQFCANDINGEHPSEVGCLSAACQGYESDYEEDEYAEEET